MALKKVYIDEVGSFRSYISDLVEEVLAPALLDHRGQLILIGTPSPMPVGYFYECSQSKEWSHHHWTMFQNPWLKIKSGMEVKDLVDQELRRKGVSASDPVIRREYYGEWSVDTNSLVFRYDSGINDYDRLPETKGRWSYVIGVDVGFDDADAIAVIGWNEHDKRAYLIHEEVQNKEGITELATRIGKLYQKYEPLKIVMDTGGLGKKIAEEISKRFGIRIDAAEKARKFEFIEILNDLMRTGQFFAKKESRFAEDCMLVEWDRDSTQLKISDAYHSDICDSILYGIRESLHWLSEPLKEPPPRNSDRWYKEQEEWIEEQAERAFAVEQEERDDSDYY
jgi:phage terminase large subunit-like protein